MFSNIKLDHIEFTGIGTEYYVKADNILTTLDLNAWIYNKDNKFYVGEIDIAGKDMHKRTILVTNVCIVRPYEDRYITVRNYYLLTFKKDNQSNLKERDLPGIVEDIIINSVKDKNGYLNKLLQFIYDNNDHYFKEAEGNED